MFERFPTPARGQLLVLGVCALAGALGELSGAGGAEDPLALLGWLAFLAPAGGALCAGARIALFPFGLCVPAAWMFLLTLSVARAARGPETPLWAACALAGLFALGWALGAHSAVPVRAAGVLFLVGLLLAGASTGFGVLAGGAELARRHPHAAARLFELSPLVLVFDCAGLDWGHAQPEIYARSGVEWFQRRPYPGNLAGPTVLVVGCALAWLASRRGAAVPAR
ncbi:MAG: hypothetical protein EXS08_03330 [Planctomycetes bacterium]|nr:hypothetical protein [Planctomycetota bacterium]